MPFIRSHRTTFKDLGPRDLEWARVPPLPFRIVLTDRDDGTRWWLTYNTAEASSDGYGYISITDVIPTVAPGDVKVYGPYDGPYLGPNPAVRLLVRGGYLGFESLDYPASTHRIMPRKRVEREIREIIFPVGWVRDAVLAWTVVDVNG